MPPRRTTRPRVPVARLRRTAVAALVVSAAVAAQAAVVESASAAPRSHGSADVAARATAGALPTARAQPTVGAQPTAGFTAGVESINHGLQRVRMVGTGPVGGSVAITGKGVEPTWTEADASGTWRATVHVPRAGTVLVATSQVTGQRVEVPVAIDSTNLQPVGKLDTDRFRRTTHVEVKPAKPGARWEFTRDGEPAGSATAGADGVVAFDFTGLSAGSHLFTGAQYYDGEHNGSWFGEQTIDATPEVTSATASRQTGTVLLTGRAPVDTTLAFRDQDGPVTDAEGRPLRVTTDDDPSWRVAFPIADRTGTLPVTVTALEDDRPVGSTTLEVTVVAPVTAEAATLPDGSVRIAGTGQTGGTAALLDDDGRALTDPDGTPYSARIGRAWELVVPRSALPADAVVVQQRVDDVEQGSLRLVLPRVPGGPSPDPGAVVPGGPTPGKVHGATERLRHGGRPLDALAWTGAEPGVPAALAVALLALGSGGLVVARTRRRRPGRR